MQLNHPQPALAGQAPDISALQARLRAFVAARDWDRFHSPKNLAMALVSEAGELTAEFRWLTEADSHHPDPPLRIRIEDEVADVFIFLMRLCDQLGIDPVAAAHAKIDRNELRFPVDRVKGRADP